MTSNERAEVLNAVQQALRGLTVSLAAATKADMPQLAYLLQAFAASPATDNPLARRMLLDLAEGLDAIGAPRAQ